MRIRFIMLASLVLGSLLGCGGSEPAKVASPSTESKEQAQAGVNEEKQPAPLAVANKEPAIKIPAPDAAKPMAEPKEPAPTFAPISQDKKPVGEVQSEVKKDPVRVVPPVEPKPIGFAKRPEPEKKDPPAAPPKPPVKEAKNSDNPQPPEKKKVGDLARRRDLIELRNWFRQLGLAYADIESTGKPPREKEQFRAHFRGSPKFMEPLDMGDVVFFYGVGPLQMPEGASNTILAHEFHEDTNGLRLVLMGDGSVREMNAAQFAKAPKAK